MSTQPLKLPSIAILPLSIGPAYAKELSVRPVHALCKTSVRYAYAMRKPRACLAYAISP